MTEVSSPSCALQGPLFDMRDSHRRTKCPAARHLGLTLRAILYKNDHI
jgi:hypothetical protein